MHVEDTYQTTGNITLWETWSESSFETQGELRGTVVLFSFDPLHFSGGLCVMTKQHVVCVYAISFPNSLVWKI